MFFVPGEKPLSSLNKNMRGRGIDTDNDLEKKNII